jgi:hypothetical protein
MLSQAFLEALKAGFWPLYVATIALATFMTWRRGAWCMGRTITALVLASITQSVWEAGTGHFLLPWQHLAIDVPVLALVTTPPRHHWQVAMAALIFVQIFLHCIWWIGFDLTEMARVHWFGCIVMGYGKCIVLAFWTGGARVQAAFDTAAHALARMVLAPFGRKLTR